MNVRKVKEKSMSIHIKDKMEVHRKTAVNDVSKSDINNVLVKVVEVETKKNVAGQQEGGEEVYDAALLAHEVFRPISISLRKGSDRIKTSMLEQKRKKYKIVSTVMDNETVSEKSGNGMTKTIPRNTDMSKVSVGKKSTFESTATITLEKNVGNAIKAVNIQRQNVLQKVSEDLRTRGDIRNPSRKSVNYAEREQGMRSRQMKAFREKKVQEVKQGEQAGNKIVNRISSKVKGLTGKAVGAVLGALGGAISLIAIVAIVVVLIVMVLYHSPFALFLPSLSATDTVQSVTNALVSDFIMEAETLANDHTGYDEGEIYYCDLDGNAVASVSQKDIMCVYMVKYGVGDAASVMDNRGKRRLETVVEDMCRYSTTDRTEVRKDEKGKKYNVSILEINVILKDYQDMVGEYGFNQERAELLETLMNQY